VTHGANDYLLVMTNLPDRDVALRLAQTLIGKGVAACVNILGECSSVYRWEGEVQTEREVPVLIKTRADQYALLQQEILACHPYELPEIVAVPVVAGHKPFLDWVSAQVSATA